MNEMAEGTSNGQVGTLTGSEALIFDPVSPGTEKAQEKNNKVFKR